MGKNQSRPCEEILNEYKRFAKEFDEVTCECGVLFVGLPGCGKSDIIKSIISNTVKTSDEDHYANFIQYQYNIGSFMINEYTQPTIYHKFSAEQVILNFIKVVLRFYLSLLIARQKK